MEQIRLVFDDDGDLYLQFGGVYGENNAHHGADLNALEQYRSSKYNTHFTVFLKNLPDPKTTRLAAIMINARTTKPPIIILFACLAIGAHPID